MANLPRSLADLLNQAAQALNHRDTARLLILMAVADRWNLRANRKDALLQALDAMWQAAGLLNLELARKGG